MVSAPDILSNSEASFTAAENGHDDPAESFIDICQDHGLSDGQLLIDRLMNASQAKLGLL